MRSLRFLVLPGLVLAAGCGYDPLGRANNLNVVDTLVSLYALSGTPPRTPSAYWLGNYITLPQTIIIQDGGPFDFAVDLDSAYRPVLKSTGALRMGSGSGVQTSTLAFDSIKIAPGGGYILDSAVTIPVGARAIVHSRQSQCDTGIYTVYYAKLEMLAVDTVSRRIDFKILVNDNCGYRSLEPGKPRH
jgi:hypothetical protein